MRKRPAERWRRRFALAALLSLPAMAGAAAGDPAIGRSLAEMWCAECHVIEPGARGTDAAPPFGELANNPVYTRERLRGWLFAPHPPMPQLHLSRVEVDAVIAYIESLKGR